MKETPQEILDRIARVNARTEKFFNYVRSEFNPDEIQIHAITAGPITKTTWVIPFTRDENDARSVRLWNKLRRSEGCLYGWTFTPGFVWIYQKRDERFYTLDHWERWIAAGRPVNPDLFD